MHSTVTMNERASRVSRAYQLLYFFFLSFGIKNKSVLLFVEFNIGFMLKMKLGASRSSIHPCGVLATIIVRARMSH